MTLKQFWVDLCCKALVTKPDSYIQIRKMFQHSTESISWGDFQSGKLPSFPEMGYRDNVSKMKQLERNYFNEEELNRVREVFIERLSSSGNKSLQTCVSARMGNQKKDSRSQGFCMQTLTINYLDDGKNPRLVIELHYRTTELIQKFLADLVFLRERVIPFIMEGWPEGLEPDEIRFNFSTCYVSLMFMPILLQSVGMSSILTEIHESDPKYYRQVISATSRLMDKECTYNYRTRANMHELFWDKVYPKLKPITKKAVKQLIKESGR